MLWHVVIDMVDQAAKGCAASRNMKNWAPLVVSVLSQLTCCWRAVQQCSTFAAKHVNDTPCRATRLRRTHVTSAIYANTGDITFGWSFQNPSPPRFTGGHVLLCASSRMGGHLRQRERKSQTTTPCIETHRTISYIIYFHIMSIDFALKNLQCISKFRFWVWTNP